MEYWLKLSQLSNSKKAVFAWCLFDWANSAFPTLILTFVFATYFTKTVALTPIIGWFTKPIHADTYWALTWMVVGTIGFEVGMVFYNAMLSDLAPKKYLGRLSGWAWRVGYFESNSILRSLDARHVD